MGWALVATLVFAGVIVARLVYLQVVVADEYSSQAAAQRTSDIEVTAKRGTIYDRNGNVLAMSIDATTIYVNPAEIDDPQATAAVLVDVLGGSVSDYLPALTKQNCTFAYVYRKCDQDKAEALKARYDKIQESIDAKALSEGEAAQKNPLYGIHYIADSKRVYPYGEIGGQVIGYVGTDNHGLSGLELYYDDILSGTDGELIYEQGKGGIAVPGGVIGQKDAVDGQDIVISIDINLQQTLEQALTDNAESSGAIGARGVVIDGATGEIYACASLPLYNLSDVSSSESGASSCKAISDAYEPGSCFKMVTAAALLETGLASLDETIEVPNSRVIYDHTIKDNWNHDNDIEEWSFRYILAHSSNIGTSLFADRLSYADFHALIEKYGFGSKTGVDFPGESSGILADYQNWSPVQKANISFGQGVSVTTLQLAAFFSAVADGGVWNQPHFLIDEPHSSYTASWTSEHIFSEQTAAKVTSAGETVASDEGSAPDVAIPGYKVSGKTGTAQIPDGSGGYKASDLSIYSFSGYLADTNSKLTCAASFDEPTITGTPAKDTFKTVMKSAIDLYKITNN